MVRNCLKDRRKPFQQIAQDTGMNISEHIVRDVGVDAEYHQRVARKVPFLTALQKRKRTAWAEEYKDFMLSFQAGVRGQRAGASVAGRVTRFRVSRLAKRRSASFLELEQIDPE